MTSLPIRYKTRLNDLRVEIENTEYVCNLNNELNTVEFDFRPEFIVLEIDDEMPLTEELFRELGNAKCFAISKLSRLTLEGRE